MVAIKEGGGEMTWWNRKAKTEEGERPNSVHGPEYYAVSPLRGTIIPCDAPEKATKPQTGYEWFEWSHRGKGVPWRINTKEFNQMLMDGWEIVDICNSFTLLKRPTFVHYLDTSKPARRKK